ncbi:putative ADP-ribosylation factor; Arf family Arf6 [Paratrimastix pyriformis]|uniref:ADP-ribosylation factor n=1 Tax=Paratrimastix pyriformis TaxID=342808 RepID=A0ABQ8U7B7_9EUKA|nr:putative ADP-ribosylation factor; Arf family Arf6 [Paratrimastix pyriformis]QXF29085.1 ArlX1 [Paratrimastix pyriformis]
MGGIFSRKKKTTILMLGLDNAGKSSIVQRLLHMSAGAPLPETIPTVGYDLREVRFKKLLFKIWDIGGQLETRPVWRHYFSGMKGLVYVVDAAAEQRFNETTQVLSRVICDPQLSGVPLLVLANKSDLPGAKDSGTLCSLLNLPELGLQNRLNWHIDACSAKTGAGLESAFGWLSDNLKK